METKTLSFGKVVGGPLGISGSYVAPSVISNADLGGVTFQDDGPIEHESHDTDEVTHTTFFGENIKRLFSLWDK
jgi:hypothetical protein